MGFDVGAVNIEYLERPKGAAYEFIKHLAGNASCVGEGNAFTFYLRSEMETEAAEFLSSMNAGKEQMVEIEEWMKKLPWDDDGCLALTFNW